MVEFKSVTKLYGAVTAVNDVSFRIEPGTLCTLLGPSGCGKTTTLRMIAGLEMVSAGTITIGGRDVTSAPASERDVSMVFQSYALFPHMSVLENVAYGPRVAVRRYDSSGTLLWDWQMPPVEPGAPATSLQLQGIARQAEVDWCPNLRIAKSNA